MVQQLDVEIFKPLKFAWSKVCENFKFNHSGCFVDKKVFAKVFKNAWTESTKMFNIVSAFKAAGICPFNPSAIHVDKSGPSIPYLKSVEASVLHSKSDQSDDNTKNASLKVVEDLMGHDKVKLFYSRFEEGYDVQEDEMYVLWSKLKSLTVSESEASINLQNKAQKKVYYQNFSKKCPQLLMRYLPILNLQANPKKLVLPLLFLNISLETKSYGFWRKETARRRRDIEKERREKSKEKAT